MAERQPVHLLAGAGDRTALCGARDALPRVVARFVPAHTAGAKARGLDFPICSTCEEVSRA